MTARPFLRAAAAGCAPRHEPAEATDGPWIVSFLPSETETLFAPDPDDVDAP